MAANRRTFLKLAATVGAVVVGPMPPPAARLAVTAPAGRPRRTLGLYLSFDSLPHTADLAAFRALVLDSGANTLVVDIKNPWGYVNVPFEHKLKARYRSYVEDPRPLEQVLNWAHRHGIYVIARQVVMMDGQLARFFPAYALHDARGEVWTDLTGTPWANPFEPLVADYNATIAEAAVRVFGFRQVQYDLIRFPSADSHIDEIHHTQRNTPERRAKAITHFLELAHERVRSRQSLLTADVFGYAAFAYQGDLGIGQDLDRLAPYLDGVSPMAYPSLYRGGLWADACPGRCTPALDHAYEIVHETVRNARQRLAAANPDAFVEPWIQAYPPARAQHIWLEQQGALDAGAAGVLAWHTNFKYYDPLLFAASVAQ
jgi:hypothetical protein